MQPMSYKAELTDGVAHVRFRTQLTSIHTAANDQIREKNTDLWEENCNGVPGLMPHAFTRPSPVNLARREDGARVQTVSVTSLIA